MRTANGVVIFLLVSSAGLAAEQERCLRFEPNKEVIAGKLVRMTFPGPPNYESITSGDREETSWFLKLSKPICVLATPDSPVNGSDLKGITLVQLVIHNEEYHTSAHLIGKRVQATGTLFTAHTGHHHAELLLSLEKLAAAPRE